jgi:hypothetical protein
MSKLAQKVAFLDLDFPKKGIAAFENRKNNAIVSSPRTLNDFTKPQEILSDRPKFHSAMDEK